MKVWYNTSFEGHWLVGTAALVIAETTPRGGAPAPEEVIAGGREDD